MSIFNESKYTKWYFSLIEKHAQPRTKINGVYTEKHHIVPKSLNGSNETFNIVRLSARVHYLAHLILVKAVQPKYRHKAVAALHAMNRLASKRGELAKSSAKLFQKLRIEYSTWLSRTKWFNDGVKSYRLLEEDASGLERGRLKLPSRKGVIAITDGVQTKCHPSNQPLPEGWSKGGSPKNKQTWAKSGDASRKRGTALGKVWANNGFQNKLVREIEKGWVRGRLTIGAFDPKHIRSLRGQEHSTHASRSLVE